MRLRTLSLLALALVHLGCSPAAEPVDLPGTWRAVLGSPGGELPFTLRIEAREDSLSAVAVNGPEEVPFTDVEVLGTRVVLRIDGYDSEIAAEVAEDGQVLLGEWSKVVPEGRSRLPFRATRGDPRRFLPAQGGDSAAALPSVAGAWAVTFTDGSGSEPARGEFAQEGERVTGTFLTPTGDYRFLEGSYDRGLLRLSTFDGGHAFLFEARAQGDGTLAGDFWSRDTYHATWTARRLADGEADGLPDDFALAGLTNEEGRFAFTFPDLDGRLVSLADGRFRGKVVLVNLFGSWCPNCNDEAPFLATWHRRYRERGLEVVGLAYEFTGDPERDREYVGKFARRFAIEYPLLLAGVSDKAAASATVPDLTRVVAYPTTVFIGRDGRVRRVHSGFSGPATGEHHRRLIAELEGLIEELLAEPT